MKCKVQFEKVEICKVEVAKQCMWCRYEVMELGGVGGGQSVLFLL